MKYLIVILGTLFYLYDFVARVMPSSITPQLMHTFHTSAAGLGIMISMFFYGYAPMQIPGGLLLDHHGPRKVLSVSIFLCGIAVALFGLTSNIYVAGACRFLIGMTASTAYISALVLSIHWLGEKYYALFAGLVQLLGCVGAIAGLAPIASLVHSYAWENVFFGTGVIGVAIAVLIFFVVRDYPKNLDKSKHMRVEVNTRRNLRTIVRTPQLWAIAVVGFCLWTPILTVGGLWGVPFFVSAYHMSAVDASGMITSLWIGVAAGGPIIGYWSRRIASRRTPLISSAIVGIIGSLMIIYLPLPSWLMLIILFIYGMVGSAMVVTFALVLDNCPDSMIGTVSGFNNMAIVFGGIIISPVIGLLLKHFWHGAVSASGTPIYSVHSYHIAFITIPLVLFIALVTSLWLIKETHGKRIATD